ncbi:MAG: hypothetical protein ACD_61C00167G0004 [uncultured bacterium]|nr:MAG: hypothetical protein ACD_61C00167G0004 [uncultured bacterium]
MASLEIYDLVVKIQMAIIELRKERKHPAEINGMLYGVLTGLNLGKARAEAGGTITDGASLCSLKILADPSIRSVDILGAANVFMPAEIFYTADMFMGLEYRNAKYSIESYAKGIRMGFRYALELLEAFKSATPYKDKSLRLTLEHLGRVSQMVADLREF